MTKYTGLVDELQDLLNERMYPIGTTRKWHDGTVHQKVAPGKWVEVPDGHDPKQGAPPGHELQGAKVFPGVGIIPDKGPWKDKIAGLPEDTLQANTNEDGSLKPERKKLHDQIMSSFLDKVKPVDRSKESPVAILMMGGPASGKSSMVRALGVDESGFVGADADAVKEKIPEYRKAVAGRARNAAAMAHEESSKLVKDIRAKAIEQDKNLVVDGTGAKVDSYLKTLEQLKKKGYHTRLMLADMDADKALPRAQARAEKTGRYVPDKFITDAYPGIPKNFLQVSKLVDEFHVFDTRGKPPKLVWSKEDGKETIHDEEWHKSFMKKVGSSESSTFDELMVILGDVEERVMGTTKDKIKDMKAPKGKKPPAVSNKRMLDLIRHGFDKDDKTMEKLPKKFGKGDGIRDVVSELE